jgi:hypothetical protein
MHDGIAFRRVVVRFDDDAYEDLRDLARQKHVPMARVMRFALDKTFEDELDTRAVLRGVEEYRRDPSSAISIEEYMASRNMKPARRRRRSR